MGQQLPTESALSRRQATLAVLPFLALGLINLISLLGWGLDPLWAFAIMPPILAITAIAWIAFRSGFVSDHRARGGTEYDEPTPHQGTDTTPHQYDS